MKGKRLFAAITAAMTAFILLALSACSGGKHGGDTKPTVEPVAVQTEQASGGRTQSPVYVSGDPSEDPTEDPGFEAKPIGDLYAFKKPLDDLCALIKEPDLEKIKRVFPEDLFNGLSETLENVLNEAGLTVSALGYESFDELIRQSFGMLDFSGILGKSGIDHIESVEYSIVRGETADTAKAVSALSDLMRYIDRDKITAAYKLNVDFTSYGDGKTVTNNADIYFYEYDGQCFILFTEGR